MIRSPLALTWLPALGTCRPASEPSSESLSLMSCVDPFEMPTQVRLHGGPKAAQGGMGSPCDIPHRSPPRPGLLGPRDTEEKNGQAVHTTSLVARFSVFIDISAYHQWLLG